ncbi:branched-chain amino acid ABC transporter permease [Mesobacterium pallidum]|uniref:branched-chain amino acid ABC transporter permease n=1 Tax=Mesobacterium pallidum TaxID=2872037 RepID=UPI001EE2A989|nr:branched-chain amino acid ABC transporter permease [Mesobacterium pallidum]
MGQARALNWLLYVGLMVLILGWLGWGMKLSLTGRFFVAGLAVGSLYALGGIGMVVLYRATGVLNLSAGAAGAAGAMTAWQLVEWGTWPPLAWLACIAVATVITLAYGRLIAPHLAWRDTVVKAVATLGFALIILGLVSWLWIDDPRSISLPTDKMRFEFLGLKVTVTRLIVFLASVALVVGIWLFLAKTKVGLQMRSLANDRDLSALIGIPILRVETIAWGIAGVIAGFTGLMFADLIRLEATVITFMVIPSVAAAVCGRLESLALVLLGGLSMGVIEAMLTLSPTFKGARPIAPFVIAALVLLWSQRGTRLTFGGRD